MARGYWRNKGLPGKTKFMGGSWLSRVNYGGIGVEASVSNRSCSEAVDADHIPHTVLPENTFSRGLPDAGAHLADELEELVLLHDASNIAAVVVEPMSGTAGVPLRPRVTSNGCGKFVMPTTCC